MEDPLIIVDIPWQLIDIIAETSSTELDTVYCISKDIQLKVKTLFFWLKTQDINWVDLDLQNKIFCEGLVNSDLLFPFLGYAYSHPEEALEEDDQFFYVIIGDSIVFMKRKNNDPQNNFEE